jgi:hypothetical protein
MIAKGKLTFAPNRADLDRPLPSFSLILLNSYDLLGTGVIGPAQASKGWQCDQGVAKSDGIGIAAAPDDGS